MELTRRSIESAGPVNPIFHDHDFRGRDVSASEQLRKAPGGRCVPSEYELFWSQLLDESMHRRLNLSTFQDSGPIDPEFLENYFRLHWRRGLEQERDFP